MKKDLLKSGIRTTGKVCEVKTCYWLKVNTKPVRMHAFDGARFPHTIRYEYEADGIIYNGKKFLWIDKTVPCVNERIDVYFDEEKPKKHTVIL